MACVSLKSLTMSWSCILLTWVWSKKHKTILMHLSLKPILWNLFWSWVNMPIMEVAKTIMSETQV
jgi:hypothetical protein